MACCCCTLLLNSAAAAPAGWPPCVRSLSREARTSRAAVLSSRRRGEPLICRAAEQPPSPPGTGAKPPPAPVPTTLPPPPSNLLPSLPVEFKPPQVGQAPPGSFLDTMAFSGPGPEIINARLAMWGFLWVSVHELTDKTTILQQAARDPFGVVSLTVIITLATFLPQWIAEVPLGELLETTRTGMPSGFMGRDLRFLRLFTVDAEKNVGRAAMVGFLLALAIELAAGAPLFGGALGKLV